MPRSICGSPRRQTTGLKPARPQANALRKHTQIRSDHGAVGHVTASWKFKMVDLERVPLTLIGTNGLSHSVPPLMAALLFVNLVDWSR